MRNFVLIVGLGLTLAIPAFAQKLDVTIINQQDNAQSYIYATFNSTLGTAAGATFQVQGATLTLQLPDNRVVVVNCEYKFAEHMAGPIGNRRSCHVPLVNDVEAEFHGDSAKLTWTVSIDGKKTQSETYKILAVSDKHTAN
jgi:hypothetical protein